VHDDRVLIVRRLRRELHQRLVPAMYSASVDLTVSAWHVPGEPVPFAEAMRQQFEPFAVGQAWGPPWGTTWFQLAGEVPDAWEGHRVEAVIDLGFGPRRLGDGFQAEGLLYDHDGSPAQGIHPRRSAVPVPATAGPVHLVVEAAANPMIGARHTPTPLGRLATAGAEPLYRLQQASLAVLDTNVFNLLIDLEVIDGLIDELPAEDPRRDQLCRAVHESLEKIDIAHLGDTVAAASAALAGVLAMPARASAHRMIAVGHAHIDSAWLWPIRETIRKCARTFASATAMMDDYPEYTFVCSQAAQYEWIEQRHPQLMGRITERVHRGQWIPVGGMWVEPDMNLPSGESLVRQLVHGQRAFEQWFGRRCDEVWIPDVFGYPASLPQIFAAGGCTRFVTQKLSWNQQNTFPHHTFRWRGLDGSEVLAHFPPVNTYNATVVPAELATAQRSFREHRWSGVSLMPYGHGNGGGGPTREMVERAQRLGDLDGSPRVQLGTPSQFFAEVEAEIAAGAPAPTWNGELYFEMHRGTLTSQLRTKLGNRRAERLLVEAEMWWAAASPAGPWPAAQLDRLWKDLLLQQFHDIVPGSSIGWVHDEAEAELQRIGATAESLIDAAFELMAIDAPSVANPTVRQRREVILIDDEPLLVELGGLSIEPAIGVEPAVGPVVTTEHSMNNGLIAVSWDLDGSVTSIIDVRAGREILPAGERIEMRLAIDQPAQYDAWDVEQWAVTGGRPLPSADSITWKRHDPLLAEIAVVRRCGVASTVQAVYRLAADSPRLDIDLTIDWHERERLLTLVVPVDVHAQEAACDIQFGHVMRPRHTNTSWDAAMFEVCAHRYVDISEPAFGVAVLNDGRYGHHVQSDGVQVSLARGAMYPDPDADIGVHHVTISILPHGPGLHEVLHHADTLNQPLRHVAAQLGATHPEPVVHIDHPGVQVSAVKRADDGSGDLVVRLAEMCGDRTAITVRCPQPIADASKADIFEQSTQAIDVADGIVAVTMRPFELVTLRLRCRPRPEHGR
jgi:alpha-mannosidase